MAGKLRLSVLHVLKLRHSGDNGWRNNYFIFAENRPLLALHQVLHDKMVVVTNEQLCCNSIKNMCAVRQATSVVQVALDEKKRAMLTNLITLQMKAAGLLAQDQFRSQFQLYQRCLFLMSLFLHFLINIYYNDLFSLSICTRSRHLALSNTFFVATTLSQRNAWRSPHCPGLSQ